MEHYLWIIGAAFVVSVVATWTMRALAPFMGYMDLPGLHRFHEHTTPLLGGAAIFLTVLIMGFALGDVFSSNHMAFYIGLIALFVLGLVDDKFALSPLVKLAGQFFAALAFYVAGFQVQLFESALLNVCAGTLWIVGIVNAMNLLDNIDGLCGTVTTIASAVLLIFLLSTGATGLSVMAAVTVGATLGFLVHNFYKAKIFLGDAGSMLLGGLVAGLALGTVKPGDGASHMAITLALAIPILDTSLVVVYRKLNGRGVLVGGKDHLSHRLANHFKLGPTLAVIVLGLMAGVAAAIAVFVRSTPVQTGLVVWLLCLCVGALTILAFRGSYTYEEKDKKNLRLISNPDSSTTRQRAG